MSRGTVDRKNLSVVLLDGQGAEALRWNVLQAYPVKWSGPDLHALASGDRVETVELAHHGMVNG